MKLHGIEETVPKEQVINNETCMNHLKKRKCFELEILTTRHWPM